jgi:hypothetical protein
MTTMKHSAVKGLLALLLILGLSACSTPQGGGTVAGLTSVSGPVIGYPYVGSATVQAFAPNDGAQLVSGTLYPSPNSRVEASLTPVSNIPATSFVNPFFCNNVVVSPASMQTTGVLLMGVADSGGTFGLVVRADAADPFGGAQVGDKLYGLIVATTAGTVTGSCVVDGANATYNMNLSPGWNHISATITAIDSFGAATAFTYGNEAPGSGASWVYSDLGVATAQEAPRTVDTIREGLPSVE